MYSMAGYDERSTTATRFGPGSGQAVPLEDFDFGALPLTASTRRGPLPEEVRRPACV